MEQTKTKKALIMSVLSMVLCIAMLIGMTFAWFTDTASTGVNKIQAGNLKVDIVNEEGSSIKGNTMDFVDAKGNNNILWEPGVKFKTKGFKIKNIGNLALKYKLALNGVTGDNKLLEVIDFTVVNKEGFAVDFNTYTGTLNSKNDMSDVLYIQGEMKTTAGNEYQGLTLNGVGITVIATQKDYESDSIDSSYDVDAEFPEYTATDLATFKAAIDKGGIISVPKDITVDNTDSVDARTIISAPTTLNLDKKIKSLNNMGNNNKNFVALIVDANTTINAGTNGGIDTGENGAYAINVRKGATLTINSGSYYGGGTAVQVQEGTLVVNGGFFAAEPFGDPYGYNFLLNCVDSAYKNGTAKIIVKGGTFVNFDPSNNTAEGARTNFVADGYKVTSETKENGVIWYTVVPE